MDKKQVLRAFAYYPHLAKVNEYVAKNLREPISLQDAARVASLESKYFARTFKTKTGITFSEWLHDMRVDRAKELLNKTDVSIGSVADRAALLSQ